MESIQIKNLPQEIKLIARTQQLMQKGKVKKEATLTNGFSWSATEQGHEFWEGINEGDFDVFYAKYPCVTPDETIKQDILGMQVGDLIALKNGSGGLVVSISDEFVVVEGSDDSGLHKLYDKSFITHVSLAMRGLPVENTTTSAEPEYKVGQRVKIISGANLEEFNGQSGIIDIIDNGHSKENICVRVDIKDDHIWCYTSLATGVLYLQILDGSEEEQSNDDKLIRRFTTGAVRSDSTGRIRPDWISPYFAQEVSKVLIDNENDFGGNNYLLGIPVLACLESLMRHTGELQEALLITKDKEQALKIARSVGFNIVSMIHSMVLQEKGLYNEVFDKTELVTVKEAKESSTYVKKEG